jgi:uncharacterized protein YfaQ (DUF2300 family)
MPDAGEAWVPRLAIGAAALGLGVAMGLAMGAARAAVPTQLAWLDDGGHLATAQQGAAPPAALRTPLGSTWKLFVHAYLHGHATQEPPYRCDAGRRQPGEEYCCDPGESVTRDEALARSCGAYFEPQRLQIAPADWARFWHGHGAPEWLAALPALQPATQLPVQDLLAGLRAVPAAQRQAVRQALLPASLQVPGVLAALGTGPRFKTWSWTVAGERAGGAAGWLADGTPFWFGAAGTSRTALQAHAGWIAAQWADRGAAPLERAAMAAQPCIEVAFFHRYPLHTVTHDGGRPAPAGALSGRYRLVFQNDSALTLDAVPTLQLRLTSTGPQITARLPLEDYVARVVDREGTARDTQAARALAVAARSHVLQNAAEGEGCRQTLDDSRAQRVSPQPPTLAARAAADFTEGLVLTGMPVRYHLDQARPGVMSWQAAVAAGRSGASFDQILRQAYPAASFAAAQAGAGCEPLPQAAHWLAQRQQRWRAVLNPLPGYQAPGPTVQVCRLAHGTPHSDQRLLVIRIREWLTREGRVTLIHEYLHLAFRHHPSGRDEGFIEQLAQRLADS